MKIIDLLNKIANGEEVSNRIKIFGEEFEYDGKEYYSVHSSSPLVSYFGEDYLRAELNEEVEILDEPKDNFTGWKMYQDGKEICSIDCSVDETKDNSIERLDIEEDAINRNERFIRKEDNKFVNLSVADYELAKKINELIDEVNKLKEE